ncbi:MAG: flagellar export protein FliJ [gamma proteobacterium symbiont of Bathyaustriella thionipta]|nr:flagellar export protein FliJ [gamma proteobacterium symbiont of Bathyaustriella thionipta]MCU7949526.1 flagellar export protein FliJ [gamma proteobacterium symbiont of Bathyaustriella thionipta]MCU7954258.1 flagellar export protein FliJ [gamma proteobacterium symbiont of Bathyaustriella thionipta]MCU7956126.1 flagellar export protein FliJ [gamma proteobacterium symbiont of Bathyaustriella thionipta]MCU7968727.1 flagellar export protein FliJ [gamma proteobacterium symbiont of Bathyaustriella
MKSKSQRMKPINKLAEKQEQQSAQVYAQCLANVRELDNQLQKLYSYRAGYNQQMIDMSKQGMGSHRLQDTLMFMSNLNQSIEAVLLQIQQQKKVCEDKKQRWMAMHTKTRIYNKVTKKYIVEEQVVQNKNEQKQVDDFNQSSFHRKLNSEYNS